MTDRFKVEEMILQCWSILEDLDYVAEYVEDNDKASNMILGLKSLYEAKFQKLWEVFIASI